MCECNSPEIFQTEPKLFQDTLHNPPARFERVLSKEFKNSENAFRSVWKTRGKCVEELCSQVKLSLRKQLFLHCVLTKIRVPAAPRKIPQVCMWLNVRADVTEFAIPTNACISCGSLPDRHQLTPISLLRAGARAFVRPGPGAESPGRSEGASFVNPVHTDLLQAFEVLLDGHRGYAAIGSSNHDLLVGRVPNIADRKNARN